MAATNDANVEPFSIVEDPDIERRMRRLREVTFASGAVEFVKRKDGMEHAMDGGLWLHRHVWLGRAMVHLVSTNRERLLQYGRSVGIPASRLQFKPLRDPRTEIRRDAWHWDLGGPVLPPTDERLFQTRSLSDTHHI
ncbi:MAG: hypothetical protein ABJB66_12340 [Gemmatimonadaceae bacterium]